MTNPPRNDPSFLFHQAPAQDPIITSQPMLLRLSFPLAREAVTGPAKSCTAEDPGQPPQNFRTRHDDGLVILRYFGDELTTVMLKGG